MNVYGVQVGQEALVIGSGNVGLITAYQMIQSGIKIKGIVEIQDKITGYDVHLNKVKKLGVPLYLGHSIKEVVGSNPIKKAILENIKRQEIKEIEVDTILLEVGLRTNSRLATLLKCASTYNNKFGGIVPIHNKAMRTSIDNVFVAGDICGIEEASTALDEGRLAGLGALRKIGFPVNDKDMTVIEERLTQLRDGVFGLDRKLFKEGLLKEALSYE